MTYTDSREGALELVHDMVDERIVKRLEDGLDAGSLVVVPDPQIKQVWAVVKASKWYTSAVTGVPEALLYTGTGDFAGFEGPDWD